MRISFVLLGLLALIAVSFAFPASEQGQADEKALMEDAEKNGVKRNLKKRDSDDDDDDDEDDEDDDEGDDEDEDDDDEKSKKKKKPQQQMQFIQVPVNSDGSQTSEVSETQNQESQNQESENQEAPAQAK